MINEYTYLGLKMTPNNKFCLATKQLSEKSLHALFKIRKHLDFHKVNPKIAMKIFDGIVSLCFCNIMTFVFLKLTSSSHFLLQV